MRLIILATAGGLSVTSLAMAQTCRYDLKCANNPYSAASPYDQNSNNNPYGKYGSPLSNSSANNPYAPDAPKLYDQQGNYRGRQSANPYDHDSTSNPYGRYATPTAPISPNNPYGAGMQYAPPLVVVPQ